MHELVVVRDKRCLKCGSMQRLQAAHIYPKGTYRKMEFDENNIICLCYRCHLHFWHKNPIEAHDWLIKTLPGDRLTILKMRSNYVDKTPQDYNLLKLYLTEEIKKYGN